MSCAITWSQSGREEQWTDLAQLCLQVPTCQNCEHSENLSPVYPWETSLNITHTNTYMYTHTERHTYTKNNFSRITFFSKSLLKKKNFFLIILRGNFFFLSVTISTTLCYQSKNKYKLNLSTSESEKETKKSSTHVLSGKPLLKDYVLCFSLIFVPKSFIKTYTHSIHLTTTAIC